MPNSRYTFFWVALGVIVLVMILFLVYVFFKTPSAPLQNTATNNTENIITQNQSSVSVTPSNSSNGSNQATVTSVTTFNGGKIQTKDFLNDPETRKDPINTGYYYLGPYDGSLPYSIEYIASSQYFNISLLQQPIGPARVDAEKYLMDHLGISAQQMCTLKYSVSVPVSVDQKHAGVDLGFSFCPTAIPLGSQ